MRHLALIFLIIALASAILGFGGLSIAISTAGRLLFFLFLVLFVGCLVLDRVRSSRTR